MRILLAALVLISSTAAMAQPEGYHSLGEFEDTSNEARQILVFQAKAGDSLRSTLDAWSSKAGWSAPRWDVPEGVDFALGSTVALAGDYKTATRSFIAALGSGANLQIRFDMPKRLAIIGLRKKAEPAQ